MTDLITAKSDIAHSAGSASKPIASCSPCVMVKLGRSHYDAATKRKFGNMKKTKATKQPYNRGHKLTGSKTAVDDPDNPFWTAADFAKAKRPEHVLPSAVLKQFPRHRGKQKAPTKIPIS